MDMATALAIAGLAVPTAAVLITAIKTRPNGKRAQNGNGTCPLHPVVEAYVKDLWTAIDEIRQDIKELLKR